MAEMDTEAVDRLAHGLEDEVRCIAEVNAVTAAEVQVLVPVGVPEPRALRPVDHELLAGAQPRVTRLATT